MIALAGMYLICAVIDFFNVHYCTDVLMDLIVSEKNGMHWYYISGQ